MLKRTITGSIYALVIVGFFLLREFVDTRLFHILTYIFTAVGTFELARMIKPYAIKGTFTTALVFGVLSVPFYVVGESFFNGYGWAFNIGLTLALTIAFFVVSIIKKSGFKQFGVSVLPFAYPNLLMLTTLLANDLENGFVALLLIFVIAPCADVMAYLIGMAYNKIRKGQAKKLCPKLSPKKTVAGAIGGLVGGVLGGLLVWLIVKPEVNFFSPVLLFLGVGLIASLLTEIGDLFESGIKRKVGVKDSGKILPGHGGVLDRIDGMSFSSVFIYLVFLLV